MARIAQPLFASSPASATAPTGLSKDTEGSRTLAGMLLAAVMAALLVVADQVISTWADGHLLAGWVALWTVAFAALALLAPPLRQVTSALASVYSRRARASALRRQDGVMWEHAKADPRLMAELQVAWMRNSEEELPFDTLGSASR
ncbi:MAG: hypothetical protein KGN32_05550 [Burkholderiales bacterium]|nr:hypothetical protein [Burkholderiales bacterium]